MGEKTLGKNGYSLATETDWSYSDTHPTGADAEIVVPNEPGKRHFITHIGASFEEDNASGKVELLTNTTTVMESFITGQPLEIEFSTPLKGKEGEETTLRLFNESNKQATVFIAGYTQEAN